MSEPKQAELTSDKLAEKARAAISANQSFVSILYDLDLLPEQLERTSRDYHRMIYITLLMIDHAAIAAKDHEITVALRGVISNVVKNLNSGAVSETASLEFMQGVPNEVRLVIEGKDHEIERLKDEVRRFEELTATLNQGYSKSAAELLSDQASKISELEDRIKNGLLELKSLRELAVSQSANLIFSGHKISELEARVKHFEGGIIDFASYGCEGHHDYSKCNEVPNWNLEDFCNQCRMAALLNKGER